MHSLGKLVKIRYSLLCCDADNGIITIGTIAEKGSPSVKRSQNTGSFRPSLFGQRKDMETSLAFFVDPSFLCLRQRIFCLEERRVFSNG